MPLPTSSSFFFNDTATTEIYTLSLHDALPISARGYAHRLHVLHRRAGEGTEVVHVVEDLGSRSEEHTSELQSRQYLVCRLLLEKKKPQTSGRPRRNRRTRRSRARRRLWRSTGA